MTKKMTMTVAALFVVSVLGGATETRAQGADCEYVPPSQYLAGKPGVMKDWSSVTLLQAPGCQIQCVAHVFCRSDHPESKGKVIDLNTKISKATAINCDPNPGEDSFLKMTCPSADACMAAARKDPTRKAKVVTPAAGGADHFDHRNMGQIVRLKATYGADRQHQNRQVPIYTFPVDDGDEPSCHLCASEIALGDGAFSHVMCSAVGIAGNSCSNANDCVKSAEKKVAEDPTTLYKSRSVPREKIVSVMPEDVGPPTPARAGGARDNSR